jgi:hypothetical protein
MGAGQQFSGRLTAQYEGAARWRLEPVGWIGLATLELADVSRPWKPSTLSSSSVQRGDIKTQMFAYVAVPALASVRSMHLV